VGHLSARVGAKKWIPSQAKMPKIAGRLFYYKYLTFVNILAEHLVCLPLLFLYLFAQYVKKPTCCCFCCCCRCQLKIFAKISPAKNKGKRKRGGLNYVAAQGDLENLLFFESCWGIAS